MSSRRKCPGRTEAGEPCPAPVRAPDTHCRYHKGKVVCDPIKETLREEQGVVSEDIERKRAKVLPSEEKSEEKPSVEKQTEKARRRPKAEEEEEPTEKTEKKAKEKTKEPTEKKETKAQKTKAREKAFGIAASITGPSDTLPDEELEPEELAVPDIPSDDIGLITKLPLSKPIRVNLIGRSVEYIAPPTKKRTSKTEEQEKEKEKVKATGKEKAKAKGKDKSKEKGKVVMEKPPTPGAEKAERSGKSGRSKREARKEEIREYLTSILRGDQDDEEKVDLIDAVKEEGGIPRGLLLEQMQILFTEPEVQMSREFFLEKYLNDLRPAEIVDLLNTALGSDLNDEDIFNAFTYIVISLSPEERSQSALQYVQTANPIDGDLLLNGFVDSMVEDDDIVDTLESIGQILESRKEELGNDVDEIIENINTRLVKITGGSEGEQEAGSGSDREQEAGSGSEGEQDLEEEEEEEEEEED